jgi:hypothetical protein
VAPRVELAGKVPKGFAKGLAHATLTVVVDGEVVLEDGVVGEFMGSFSGLGPKESPFLFEKTRCLFTAHNMQDKLPEGRPAGLFLPRGTMIKATIKGMPWIPMGVEIRIGGVGSHYSPDANAQKRCTVGECRSKSEE